LVRPGIRVWREHLNKTELLDEEGVRAKMGISPAQIPDYLGLLGDSSDNIPGVKGIGDKTAVKLLLEYGNLEAILAAAPTMKKSKMAENLQTLAADARLSRELATIKTDCVTDFSWDRFRWTYQPDDALRAFLKEMEFRNMLKELGPASGETSSAPEPAAAPSTDAAPTSDVAAVPEEPGEPSPDRPRTLEERTVDYRTLTTRLELEEAVGEIRRAGRAAIDTETTDLDPYFAELVGVSISWRKNQAVYIPVGHRERDARQMPLADLREVLGPVLGDPAVKWVAHHWDFDYKILKMAGLKPGTIADDTMIAAFVANPERGDTSLRLKALALNLLGIKMTEISELIGSGDDLVTMSAVSIEDSSRYACQDADATLQLHEKLSPLIDKAGVRRLHDEVELPLINVLAEMELEGVRIDREYFRQLSQKAATELQALTATIHGMVGRPFNINSPSRSARSSSTS
jgi:DNA polymerase-1